jgi:glycine/D-amino acid oxidase-like deaminating enzyme
MSAPKEIYPGLPVSDPTTPFWQVPRHKLAEVSSAQLPSSTDVLIIGSGMTGCSVAKELLQSSEDIKITVLEARTLLSGASSRNGGHIVSPCFGDFEDLIDTFGEKTAVELAVFSENNVDKTFEVVREYAETGLEKFSKIRRTERVASLLDQETFEKVQRRIRLWNNAMPENRRHMFRLINDEEAKKKYGLKNVFGAVVGPGAAAWPYRLWCGIWDVLLCKYGGRLTVETRTPALSVTALDGQSSGHRYRVQTPRGTIEASHVVYCTNGYTSHLLPKLSGKLFPFRGTMTAQDLGPSFLNRAWLNSWSFLSQSRTDPESGVTNPGLYYLTQDPHYGYMMLGGEYDKLETIVSSDDSQLNPISAEKVVELLPKVFDGVSSAPEVKSIWSGVMGFTTDGLPLIGPLSECMTGRKGSGEWIAAGFNGYGTGYCLSCGVAVAQMILGKDVSSWVPAVLFLTDGRLAGTLSSGNIWTHVEAGSEEQPDAKL